MGLDTSHDCWHGPYSAFMRWRTSLAHSMGIPYRLMQGLGVCHCDMKKVTEEGCKAIIGSQWSDDAVWLKHLVEASSVVRQCPWSIDPAIAELLSHSDCDGRIRWWNAGKIAIALGRFLRSPQGQSLRGHNARNPSEKRADYDGTYEATKRFALGCAKAYRLREDVYFR